MRVGSNPNKNKKNLNSEYFHQVVVPVYIPNQEGYFKDSFMILRLCLESLFKTSHKKTYFTIVNNGSCREVKLYLDELFQEKKIHEIIHTTNIGYVNAMLKGITGQNFKFITNADADVLFLNDWQEESYAVFAAFPKTGVVSPTPHSKMIRFLTGNIYFDRGFTKSIKFSEVINPKAMVAFAKSIDYEDLFKDINLQRYLTISEGEFSASIGAPHFVVTYRSDVFNKINKRFTEFILGGDSDYIFDYPVINNGLWRLSTVDNYAYHMGNTVEEWMIKRVVNLKTNTFDYEKAPKLAKIKTSSMLSWFKINIFSRILFLKPIWRLFLRYKGLNKIESKIY